MTTAQIDVSHGNRNLKNWKLLEASTVRYKRYKRTFIHKPRLQVAISQINNPGKSVCGLRPGQSRQKILTDMVPWGVSSEQRVAAQREHHISTMMPWMGSFQLVTNQPRTHNPLEVRWFSIIVRNCIWVIYVCVLYSLFAWLNLYLFSELYAQDFLNIYFKYILNILVPYACFSRERSFISPHLYFVFNFPCISMLCIKLFPLKHKLCLWKIGFLWLKFRLMHFSILPGVWVPPTISRDFSPKGNSFICLRSLL